MNISTSKLLVAVAFVFFVLAVILVAVKDSLGLPPEGWAYAGLAAWALAVLA